MNTIKVTVLILAVIGCQNKTVSSNNESDRWEFKTTNTINVQTSPDAINSLNYLTKSLDWKTTCYVGVNCADSKPIEYTYRFYFEITHKEEYLYIRTSKKACSGSYDERNEYRIPISSLIVDNIEFQDDEDVLNKPKVYYVKVKTKFNNATIDFVGEEREQNKDAKLMRTRTDSLKEIEFGFNDKGTALRVLDSFKIIAVALSK